MSRNDAEDYAQRLYALMPAHYRAYDRDQGEPLLMLMRVVGEQVANLRQDMDGLWDNFFIETCDDWVVPYIGALVGTNLIATPVGQSNRLDVRDTVTWRRSKGTPAMLQALGGAISGWPTALTEFFQAIGWSQNLNHLRLDHPLLPSVRAVEPLGRLGLATDPFAHAIDVRPGGPLDQARLSRGTAGAGRVAWGTPGRYGIKTLGFFVNRLATFKLSGATPALISPTVLPSSPPSSPPRSPLSPLSPPSFASGVAVYCFAPLFDAEPLFVEQTGTPLTRAAFGAAPWETFGKDVAVRQFGVLLASDAPPFVPSALPIDPNLVSHPFTFGGAGAGLALNSASGLQLLDPRAFSAGGAHFVITALWQGQGTAPVTLGSLSTRHAALNDGTAFLPGASATATGQLVIQVQPGRAGLGWPGLSLSRPARFLGAVLAVRAARTGALRVADALYITLPPAHVSSQAPATFFVAEDGGTFTSAGLDPSTLARASEGQVYPPRTATSSLTPIANFTDLNRSPNGLRLPDLARFGGTGALFEVQLFQNGQFTTIAAIATIAQAMASDTALAAPAPWPALNAAPSKAAQAGTPGAGLLVIRVAPLAGSFVPASELTLVNRDGQSLLIYLRELTGATSQGAQFFVADDGSTFEDPPANADRARVALEGSFAGLTLARGAVGQVLPIPGVWPLRQRQPVAINLCRYERSTLLQPGELGIDPELGRFAFAPNDLAIGQAGLSVDYVEAFSDRVGARTFDRTLDPVEPPSRLRVVTQVGDASGVTADRLHTTLADAIQKAQDLDVIEIADSATYQIASAVVIPATLQTLTIRAAASQRPCLAFFDATGAPTPGSLRVTSPMKSLTLNGLFLSGGPLRIENVLGGLSLFACTLDPRTTDVNGSLVAAVPANNVNVVYQLSRCITGGLCLGAGVEALVVADSIIDQQGGVAVGGIPTVVSPAVPIASPPIALPSPPHTVASPPVGSPPVGSPPSFSVLIATSATNVQLERATVFGSVLCEVILASECLFVNPVTVEDQQTGCVRYSRYEPGSVLPRKFQTVPAESSTLRLAPVFQSLQFGRPGYAQLGEGCPSSILTASEQGSEVGAFAASLNPIRLANLQRKIQEFLPVGLTAQIISQT